MAYDLLIRNGRIVDGSGMPAFHGDIGVKDGKIVEIGKIKGAAERTVDAEGLAVSPGFIDNHCHYDAQVTWDPLCTFSPQHGATTVIFGNCSLSLAPVRRGNQEREQNNQVATQRSEHVLSQGYAIGRISGRVRHPDRGNQTVRRGGRRPRYLAHRAVDPPGDGSRDGYVIADGANLGDNTSMSGTTARAVRAAATVAQTGPAASPSRP